MSKIRIATVSYLNSIPFTYGIESSGAIDAELTLATPAECSRLLGSGDVDLALVPVAALSNLGVEVEVVTSHCIGAVGAVRTVALFSDDALSSIKRVWLDVDSQTSIKLLAHLCEHHFHITPEWHFLSDKSRLAHPEDGDAFLLIGDKVFEHEGEFEYTIDLAEEWVSLTSLPFVFAVWVAPVGTDDAIVEQLELALEWGVEHTFEALQALRPDVEMEDGYRYLTESIDTQLDGAKRQGMELFLSSDSKITIKR